MMKPCLMLIGALLFLPACSLEKENEKVRDENVPVKDTYERDLEFVQFSESEVRSRGIEFIEDPKLDGYATPIPRIINVDPTHDNLAEWNKVPFELWYDFDQKLLNYNRDANNFWLKYHNSTDPNRSRQADIYTRRSTATNKIRRELKDAFARCASFIYVIPYILEERYNMCPSDLYDVVTTEEATKALTRLEDNQCSIDLEHFSCRELESAEEAKAQTDAIEAWAAALAEDPALDKYQEFLLNRLEDYRAPE